ncbi:MAG: hypothetical protein JOZ41_16685 [Chloroflexi bacterium]|nr:hypothetical protein [Chloroflexota bacterium]
MWRALILVAALGVVLLLLGTGLLTERFLLAEGPPPTRDGWILYSRQPLAHSRTYFEQLPRDGSGNCISRSIWIPPRRRADQPPIARQEIAYNPTTCQIEWEEGTPLSGSSPNPPDGTGVRVTVGSAP